MKDLVNYKKEISKKVSDQLGIKNPMATPKLSKITVNMGVKNATADKKNVEKAAEVLGQITGQKAKITKARMSIASFKLREGEPIGVVATLRGERMYDFLTKLVSIVLPRLRDFRGISKKSFDGHGNYTLGLSEYTVFPEIDPGKVDRVQGLEICVSTTAKNNEQGLALLTVLGMPFEK